MKLGREGEIVLDRVGRTHDFGILASDDRAHHFHLHLERQAGGKAIDVDFVRRDSLRFEKYLLTLLLRELDDLILDGRAIARADAFDDAGIHGRLVKIGPDDLGRGVGRISDIARQLAIDLV